MATSSSEDPSGIPLRGEADFISDFEMEEPLSFRPYEESAGQGLDFEAAGLPEGTAMGRPLPAAASRDATRIEAAIQAVRDELESKLEEERSGRVAALKALKEGWEQERARLTDDLAAAAVKLGLAVAERLVRRELSTDAQAIERVVRALLWKLPEAARLRLRVHPEDAEVLAGQPELLDELGVAQVVADRRVARGGCLVETERATWDATIDGQLEQVRAALDALLEHP